MAALTPDAVVMQDLFTRLTLNETTIGVHHNEQIRLSNIVQGIQGDHTRINSSHDMIHAKIIELTAVVETIKGMGTQGG